MFKWFISYLTNRTQSVSVGDLNSLPLPLKYSVPQGSFLGPILFTLYSQPVSDKIREHNISYQKFADDTQLHKASQPTEFQCLVSDFESCFLSVKAWMLSNKLKRNDEEAEAMLVGSRQTSRLQDFIFVLRGKENLLAVTQMTNTNVHNGPDTDARHTPSPPPPPPPPHTHTRKHVSTPVCRCEDIRHKHTLLYITIHVKYNWRTEKHYVKNAVRTGHKGMQYRNREKVDLVTE